MIERWRYRPKMGRKNLDIGQSIAENAAERHSIPCQEGTLLGIFMPCPKVGDTIICYGGITR